MFSAPYVLLEDRLDPGAAALLYAHPQSIIRCDEAGELDTAFQAIERGLAAGLHAAGLFSYELGYVLEPKLAPLLPAKREVPLLWLGLFDEPKRIDAAAIDGMFASLGPPPPVRLDAVKERRAHVADVLRALDLIKAGDIYQVNLTFALRFHYEGDPLALFAAMRVRQPVGYGGVAALGDTTVLSVSPELWIQTHNGFATARPMKGTVARGVDHAEDDTRRADLAEDHKQRAENLMIVDLLRNDLSRISDIGSVRVPALFAVETYPTLHALTSTITSRLRAGTSLRGKVEALFPCASVVGAPKIRAGEVIRAVEPFPRGFYTGGLGAIAPNGDMRFNVAIRTAVIDSQGRGQYGVGGGIVSDSEPDAEYDEAMLKARVVTDLAREYRLIETFRWSAAEGYVRLRWHLARMTRSARLLGFIFCQHGLFDTLAAREATWTTSAEARSTQRRVRIVLSRDGAASVTDEPLTFGRNELRFALASERLDPGDPFLAHKTTEREIYERAFTAAGSAGLDEAVLLNRHGDVAEATRNTVFVDDGDRLATPPLSCGVLPGVLRQTLLDSGAAREARITPAMLAHRAVWLGNSLRGLRRAVLAR